MKDKDTTYLDELFGEARMEEPRTDFQSVEKRFATSLLAGGAISTAFTWKGFFSLNFMIIGLATLGVVGVVLLTIYKPSDTPLEARPPTVRIDAEPEASRQFKTDDTLFSNEPSEAPLTELTVVQKPFETHLAPETAVTPLPDGILTSSVSPRPMTVVDDKASSAEGIARPVKTSDRAEKKTENQVASISEIQHRHIDQSSTQEEIQAVLAELSRVGIRNEFSQRDGRSLRRKLKLKINGSTRSHDIRVDRSDDWRIDIAWREDAQGRAIEFVEIPGKTIEED